MRKLYLFLLSVIVAGTLFQSQAFTDLYIRGGQFGWEAKDCTDANKFTTTDGNVYKITLETLKSGFKIATVTSTGGWDNNYNFGSASNIEPGNEYTLTTAWDSGNITTKGGVDLTNVTLTFTLSTKKLKVEGQAEEAKYPEALYMVGDFNGWNTSDANYKMTREGDTGKYVIKNVNIEKGKQIKFCTGSWANNWGAATDGDPLPVGTEFVPNYNANNYKLTEALSNATIEFYYNIENIESAKAKVTNGGVTPPEPTFPEKLYVVGQVDGATEWAANHGVLLVKDGSVYTIESIKVEDAGEGSGYFGLATQLGATADSWNGATGLNGGDRYGAKTKDAPLAPGAPATIVKFAADVNASAAYSWKVAAGTYSLTADLDAMTISIVKKDDPTPPEPEYPELYIRGSFTDNEAKPEYKMTREGKVYTITGIEIPAGGKFKIADNTSNWTVNFGGTGIEGVLGELTDELTNGIEKNAWFNSSINFTVAKKLTNATVTFTFEGAKDGVASKIKVEGTEEVTPPEPEKYTVKFDNSVTKWETVSAFFFGGEYEGAAWPGVAMTKESGDIWTVSIDKGTVAPTKIIFNDGKAEGAKQTSEFAFEDGKTYKAELKTITVKYNNGKTKWNKVYAYFWKEGAGDVGPAWHGTEMTLESGTIYTVSLQVLDLPTNVKFNDGADAEGATEIFENGKTYGEADDPTPPEPEYPELYVRGSFTNYEAKPEYKMTREGKVYTITGIEIPEGGKFKISDNTSNWTVNFGGTGIEGVLGEQTDELTNGTEKNAWFNSSVNFTVTKKLTNATVTFTFEGAKDGVANKIKVEGTEEVTPPEPEYPELYVRGTMTDYNVKPEYKMTREGKVYTLSGIEIPAGAKFKISDNTDNWAINFGGTGVEGVEGEQTDELANGTEKNAWFNSSVNFTVAKKLTNATVTFTFEGAKTGVANKIKVEGTEEVTPPEPEYPELYVRGTMTDYNVKPEYKMTREGKVYTLSGIEIPAGAKFKISDDTDNWAINFGGTGVEGVEGEQTDELANGTEKNAWFNSSVNFTVAKKLTNATVTFTFEGAKTGVANKIKVEGTEVDDPQPENPDLYIIGLNNDWNNFPASNKFTHAEGTTVYTLELASMAAGTNFKFCPENWGGEGEHLYVFGAENADNGKITEAKLNTSINMKRSDTGSANFVTEPKLKDVKITLDINYTTQVYTMKLEGTVDTEPVTIPEHPEFYLVGTFAQSTTGGWDTIDDWKFTCDEATNTYTIEGKTFEADAQFKIAPKNWEYPEIVFGAATAEQDVTFNEAINLTKGNDASKNFKFTEKAENVKLVFKYVADGTSTLTVTKTSGIGGIESGIDGEAEYYNMQGVRVMNPEEGIYIVRRGNKVTKEIVRK